MKKLLLVGSALFGGAVSSFAAVSFDTATKTFSGDMDLGAYYSATEIAIGVLAITLAITLGMKMLKKSA
jgi:fluoride ion exporter CrcB/FEX